MSIQNEGKLSEEKLPSEAAPPRDAHRMSAWILIAALLFGWVAYYNPADIPVAIWKGALICFAAGLGYWIDRSAFPYGRPDKLVDLYADGEWTIGEGIVFGTAMLRRAIIMAAFALAVAGAV